MPRICSERAIPLQSSAVRRSTSGSTVSTSDAFTSASTAASRKRISSSSVSCSRSRDSISARSSSSVSNSLAERASSSSISGSTFSLISFTVTSTDSWLSAPWISTLFVVAALHARQGLVDLVDEPVGADLGDVVALRRDAFAQDVEHDRVALLHRRGRPRARARRRSRAGGRALRRRPRQAPRPRRTGPRASSSRRPRASA